MSVLTERNTRVAGGERRLSSPMCGTDFDPLPVHCALVQSAKAPSDDDAKKLASLLEAVPDVVLRLYGDNTCGDLSVLKHFPKLQRLQIEDRRTISLDGLKYATELRRLAVYPTKARLSAAPLRTLRKLDKLWLEKPAAKGLEVLGDLSSLRSLSLTDASLPKSVGCFPGVEFMQFDKCKMSRLPQLPAVEQLYITSSNVGDMSALAEMANLEGLMLSSVKGADELPELSGLAKLRVVRIERTQLASLDPIAAAPGLEKLIVVDREGVAERFAAFKGHASLKKVSAKLRDDKELTKLREMLGIEVVSP